MPKIFFTACMDAMAASSLWTEVCADAAVFFCSRNPKNSRKHNTNRYIASSLISFHFKTKGTQTYHGKRCWYSPNTAFLVHRTCTAPTLSWSSTGRIGKTAYTIHCKMTSPTFTTIAGFCRKNKHLQCVLNVVKTICVLLSLSKNPLFCNRNSDHWFSECLFKTLISFQMTQSKIAWKQSGVFQFTLFPDC